MAIQGTLQLRKANLLDTEVDKLVTEHAAELRDAFPSETSHTLVHEHLRDPATTACAAYVLNTGGSELEDETDQDSLSQPGAQTTEASQVTRTRATTKKQKSAGTKKTAISSVSEQPGANTRQRLNKHKPEYSDTLMLAGVVAIRQLPQDRGEVIMLRTSVQLRRKGIGEILLHHATKEAKLGGTQSLLMRIGFGSCFQAATVLSKKQGWYEGYRFNEAYEYEGSLFLKKDL